MATTSEFLDYEITDAASYAAVLRGSRVELSQLAPGPLRGHHLRAGLPGGGVSWVETNLPLRGNGRFPPGAWTLSVVTGTSTRSFQHGTQVRTGTIFAHGPDASQDGLYGRNFSVVCVALREALFENIVKGQFPEVSDLLKQEWSICEPSGARRRDLVVRFRQAARILRSDELVRRSTAAITAIQDELVGGFLGAFAQASPAQPVRPLAHAAELVRRSEKLVAKDDDHSLQVGDLCAGCGVPRRTLSLAFRKVLGMGPATYLRRLRLNRARRVLMCRDSGGRAVQVARVALDHGFWHLGRFSAQYRELFGENPSESARRSGASVDPLP